MSQNETGRFKKGDYVRKKKSQYLRTGWIAELKDFKGRYTVKVDPSCNDMILGEEFLAYEEELEHCIPPTKKN